MKVNNPLPKDRVAISKAKRLYGNAKHINWSVDGRREYQLVFPKVKEWDYQDIFDNNKNIINGVVLAKAICGHFKSVMYLNTNNPSYIEYYE